MCSLACEQYYAPLQTHGIWQSAIGYDPYAPNKDDSKNSSHPQSSGNEPDADNPYNSYQDLLALARTTNTNADEARGTCKKCGHVRHLTFQCKNFLSVKDDNKEKDPEAIQAAVLSELDKVKGKVGKLNGKGNTEIGNESEEEEEEESDSSDSDADSEIERIIGERYWKKVSNTGRLSRKKEWMIQMKMDQIQIWMQERGKREGGLRRGVESGDIVIQRMRIKVGGRGERRGGRGMSPQIMRVSISTLE